MKCEELITYLSDYIDQNLSDELRADAQEHLSTCKNCHIVLDTTQKMIFLYRQNGKQSIPAGQRKDLFLRLQQRLNQSDQ